MGNTIRLELYANHEISIIQEKSKYYVCDYSCITSEVTTEKYKSLDAAIKRFNEIIAEIREMVLIK